MDRLTMTRWWLGLALLATATGLVAAPRGSDKPADSFSDETTTMLVEVPVEVTSNGEPVRGLTAANFELFDNGRAQEIASIDVVDLQTITTPEKAAEMPVAARRHFLLLFDFTFSQPASLSRAQTAAVQLIEKDLHPTDLVGLATFSVRDGVKFVLGFTQDRSQIRAALGQLRSTEEAVLRPDPLRLSVGKIVDADYGMSGGGGRSGARAAADDAGAEIIQQMMASEKKRGQQLGRREVKILSDSMVNLAATMRSLQGRKHVVYFSEGFDPSLMLGSRDEEEKEDDFQATTNGEIWKVDSDQMFGSREAISAMDQLTSELKKADCILHSVDIGGLRTSSDAGDEGSSGLGAAGRGKDGLVAMARDTGGDVFENFNDLGTAMGHLLQKTSVTYLLTYHPSDVDNDGKYRKLKVKLKNVPSAKLTHRPGYFAPKAGKTEEGLGSMLATSQRLFDRDGGDIKTALVAVPQRSEINGLRYVPAFFEVDGSSFLGMVKLGRENQSTRADLFIYAFDENGGVVDLFTQAVSLDLAKMGDNLRRTGFKVYAPMLLPPGRFTLRAMVRDAATGRTGVTHDNVVVPAEPGLALLPPLVPETTDTWVMVRGRRKDFAEGQTEPAYPFAIGEQGYAPAAAVQASAGERMPMVLAGYDLQDADLEARLVDLDGNEVSPLVLQQVGGATRSADGMIQQLVGLTMPAMAGAYRLELVAKRGEGQPELKESVAVELRSEADTLANAVAPRTMAFKVPAATASGGMAVAQARPSYEDPALSEKAAATWRAGYRAELGKLGSDPESLSSLAQFEVAALGADPGPKVARLGRAETDIADQLAKKDPEALLPLLEAHLNLFLMHQAAKRPYLELHSRNMVRELAEHYANAGGGQGSRVVAARALVSLGGYLLADGRSAAIELLERAALLDPANEAAHLALAAYYEKRGGPYDQAVSWLEKLVANRPDCREGKLRLAINLLRVAETDNLGASSRRERAAGLFTALIAEPGVDWITSLAVQELARYHASSKRYSEAVAVLEKNLDRLPGDQEVLVQLTFLYDRMQKDVAGRQFAAKVGRGDRTPGMAPRGQYNQWQSEALTRDRTELHNGARTRLKILDQILTSVGTGEGR